jgi:transposase
MIEGGTSTIVNASRVNSLCCAADAVSQRLAAIPGIGPIIATAIIAAPGDQTESALASLRRWPAEEEHIRVSLHGYR